METELTPENNHTKDDPKIDTSDHAAFDALADAVFTTPNDNGTSAETKPEPVQKPVTAVPGKEAPASDLPKQGEQVTPTPEKKVETTPAAIPPKEDKDLDAVVPPRGLSPKNLEGWNALKTMAREAHTKASALEAEVTTLRANVGKPAPELQTKLTTLEKEVVQYRAIYQNERSPEFVAKYDTKISANETSAEEVLKRNGLPDTMLAEIKKIGGIHKVNSATISKWIGALSLEDGEAVKKAYLGNKELLTQREGELETLRGKPEEFEAKQREQRTQDFNKYTSDMATHVNAITKDIPWCKMQDIPADATPEVKARIEKENKFYQESEQRFQAMLYPKDAVTRAETALAACLSFKLAEDVTQMQATAKYWHDQYAQANMQLEAIKKAGVTSRSGINSSKNDAKPALDLNATDDDAVEAGLKSVGA